MSEPAPAAEPEIGETGRPVDEEQKLVAKADENDALNRGELPDNTPEVTHDAPEWLGDESARKYFDPATGEVNYEAMAKELSYLRGVKPGQEPAAEEGTPSADDPAEETNSEEGTDDVIQVDFDALASELSEKGELTDESYAALEAQGISREMTDLYVEGLNARMASVRQAAFDVVGGEDQYTAFQAWVTANLPQAERVAFDAAVSVLDPAAVTAAVQPVYQKYVAAHGREPSASVGGNANTAAGNVGFATKAEMQAAISDPRYGIDVEFTRQTRNRIVNSPF